MIQGMNLQHPPGQVKRSGLDSMEEKFSFILDRSNQKQAEPIRQKTNQYNDTSNKPVNEKPIRDAKKPISNQPVVQKDQTAEIKSEEKVIAKEKTDEAMKAVADVLGISPEDLENMLAVMQIGLLDLLKGNNMQGLMMEVHGAEEAMDLLLIPDITADMKKVTGLIEAYLADLTSLGETAILTQASPGETGEQIQQAAQTPEQAVDQGGQLMTQTNTRQVTQTKAASEAVQVEGETETPLTILSQHNDMMLANQEESTHGGNNPANQFLDHLAQSMGEVFSAQTNQVSESFEAVISKADPVNPRMVLDQIIEKIKVSSLESEAKMMIQLKPEHLGKLSMEVISKQGLMTAHIMVENEKTKALLEQNIQSLKENLEEQGMVIQALEVAVGQNQNEDRPADQNRKPTKNISDLISQVMNEEVPETLTQSDNVPISGGNEVDFIA